MNIPEQLLYSDSHEWVEKTGEGMMKVGLTDHAQQELGDLVFVNLPAVGDTVTAGESFADVESVKAVSDVYSPVSGVVAAVNEELLDAPEKINEDCYAAWLVEVREAVPQDGLMDAAAYAQLVGEG